MMVRYSIGLCILLSLILLCRANPSRDGIGFGYPESEEEDPNKQNILHKRPIHIPSRCKAGELLYPGDQNDDWVCDCRPGYIYFPAQEQCYAAFERGPCRFGEYLILPKDNVIPTCVRNPCSRDNYVLLLDACYKLHTPGPCPVPEIGNIVGVNETTLDIICTKGFLNNRNNFDQSMPVNETTPSPPPITDDPEFYDRKECFIGGKRWTYNNCTPIYNQYAPIQQIKDNTNMRIQSIFKLPSQS